jgi:hypothetical protein
MSIDLTVRTRRPLGVDELLDITRETASDLTGTRAPAATLSQMQAGGTRPITQGTLGNAEDVFVLSWLGSDDGVAITTHADEDGRYVITFSVGATRSPTEYVLALTAALATAKREQGEVLDPWHFWGDADALRREELAPLFHSPGSDFSVACNEALRRREGKRGG